MANRIVLESPAPEYELWEITGVVQRNGPDPLGPGENWNQTTGLAFTAKFLCWLDEQGLGFGGLIGPGKEAQR